MADGAPLVEQPLEESFSGELLYDPASDPLAASCDVGFACDACPPGVRPINWISGPYFKSGVAMVLADGVVENQDAGYTISGGLRQALGPDLGGDRLFLDLGGSYLSAFGTTVRNTAGLRVTSISGFVINEEIVADAFTTTLDEVRRGSVHAALGWYWGSPLDNRSADPQVRVATRFGGRVGHVRGRFGDDVPLIMPGANQTISRIYGKTDTFGGLFVGTEAILLQRDTSVGHIQWTLDGELANDWIEFEAFEAGTMGTASIMLGFMLSR